MAPLRLGLCGDQIGKAFDRGQIQSAVLERAAGELARLRQPAAIDRAQDLQGGSDHGAPAVELQRSVAPPFFLPHLTHGGRKDPHQPGDVSGHVGEGAILEDHRVGEGEREAIAMDLGVRNMRVDASAVEMHPAPERGTCPLDPHE